MTEPFDLPKLRRRFAKGGLAALDVKEREALVVDVRARLSGGERPLPTPEEKGLVAVHALRRMRRRVARLGRHQVPEIAEAARSALPGSGR